MGSSTPHDNNQLAKALYMQSRVLVHYAQPILVKFYGFELFSFMFCVFHCTRKNKTTWAITSLANT